MKKLMLLLLAMGTLVAGVTGCNTTQGAGEDLENAGESIQDAAR